MLGPTEITENFMVGGGGGELQNVFTLDFVRL